MCVGLATLIAIITPWRLGTLGAPLVLIAVLTSILSFRPTRLDLAAAAFVSVTWLSLTWTEGPELTRQLSSELVMCLIIFLGVRTVAGSRRGAITICLAFLAACGIAVAQLVSQAPAVGLDITQAKDYQATLTGLNRNAVAYTLSAGVFVLAVAAHLNRMIRAAALLVTPLLYLGALLTGGLGGTVGVALATVVWVIPPRVRGRLLKPISASLAAFAVLLISGRIDQQVDQKVGEVVPGAGLHGRSEVWATARDVFFEHPFFGLGGGALPAFHVDEINAHNVVLDVATGLGVLGLGTLLWLSVQFVRTVRTIKDRTLRGLLGGTLAASLAPSLLTGYWYQSPALWVVLGLAATIPATLNAEPLADSMAR